MGTDAWHSQAKETSFNRINQISLVTISTFHIPDWILLGSQHLALAESFYHLPTSLWSLGYPPSSLAAAPRAPELWSRLNSHRIVASAPNPVITTLFFPLPSTTLCFGQKKKDFKYTVWFKINTYTQWL